MPISTPMSKIEKETARLHIETFDCVIGRVESEGTEEGHPGFPVTISVARLGKDGRGDIHEIVFQWQGRPTTAYMREIFRDMSIAVSRAMQGRDAMTGDRA